MIRSYAGSNKMKRPMSASNMAASGRNARADHAVGTTLTAQNSKMPKDVSNIDIKRMKPKRITQEKEKLYEEAIRSKIQMNNYKEENINLRTKLKFMEKELFEKEQIIEKLVSKNEITTIGRLGNMADKKKNKSYLENALKRQVKELKLSLKEKDDELSNLK